MNRACVIYYTSLMSSNSFIYFNITTKISLFSIPMSFYHPKRLQLFFMKAFCLIQIQFILPYITGCVFDQQSIFRYR